MSEIFLTVDVMAYLAARDERKHDRNMKIVETRAEIARAKELMQSARGAGNAAKALEFEGRLGQAMAEDERANALAAQGDREDDLQLYEAWSSEVLPALQARFVEPMAKAVTLGANRDRFIGEAKDAAQLISEVSRVVADVARWAGRPLVSPIEFRGPSGKSFQPDLAAYLNDWNSHSMTRREQLGRTPETLEEFRARR